MGIPESKFNDWHKTGADVGSMRARKMVYNALRGERSPLQEKADKYDLYLQGSYASATHTRSNSDIDIVVKQTSAWGYDLSDLSTEDERRYRRDHSPATYTYEDFREDVFSALKTKFGAWNVSWDDKAMKISKESTSLPVDVDVIACTEYRVYHSYPEYGEPNITRGMYFKPRFGIQDIINYPKLHIKNGRCKSKKTSQNYKETVRIFKNARDYTNNQRVLFKIDAPSYYIECSLFNLDNDLFKRTNRSDRFIGIVEALETSNFDSFDQQCDQNALFGNDPTQWSKRSARDFVDAMRKLWDEW